VPPQQQQQQQQQQGPPQTGKTPLEFNHAINYVNKIKNRFKEKQEVYIEFLDILHTYQKEQKEIEIVYSDVASLFRSEPDLLDEFSQFLPEAIPQHIAAKKADEQARQFEAAQKKSRGGSRKEPKQSAAADMRNAGKKIQAKQPDGDPANMEELVYFDKVKKALKTRHVYDNFLRCLNLYSCEIISRQELVELVSGFLSKFPDLFAYFKNFVGLKDRPAPEVAAAAKNIQPQPELDLRTCKQQNKNYRALPEMYTTRVCSGRKDLDPKIAGTLNDRWVSFPTWSEEATFQATKKNHHEEAIFRCEDERFELDIIIEANLATIRNLDMVVKTLEDMTPELQRNYKFNTKTLGGVSEVIHRKAVERLYGERKEDVFAAMQRDPLNNIPIVLKRLKQKNLEWRNTQRQWNAIWRELNEKNYLRSLDYMAVSFKRNDPFAFKPKTLKEKMIDLRNNYRVWVNKKREAGETVTAPDPNGPPPPIVSFVYDDIELFESVNRLIMYVVKRSASTNAASLDVPHVQSVLDSFTMELLAFDPKTRCDSKKFLPGTGTKDTKDGKDGKDKDGTTLPPTTNDTTTSMVTDASAPTPNDQKDASNIEDKDSMASKVAPKEVPKDSSDAMDVDVNAVAKSEDAATNDDSKKKEADQKDAPKDDATDPTETKPLPETTTFYANRHWFVYFRLHQIIYTRLRDIKAMSNGIAKKHAAKMASGVGPSPAIALCLRTPLEYAPDGYFDAFLNITEKLIDNAIDATTFEDTVREMFNTAAYKMFTIDRLLTSIAKKLMAFVNDDCSRALAGLYLRHRDGHLGGNYGREAFDLMSDQNIYKIEHKGGGALEIELLDMDLMVDYDAAAQPRQQWKEYVNKYREMESVDPRLEELSKNPVFLKRNRDKSGEGIQQVKALENVELVDDLQFEDKQQPNASTT